ncbi:MAG TPA: hypothetical protein VG733_03120 [Chthoniobacteraceae bacterium]|nr:hypothetical protein [Chthoniobacteraceae bacterium]
MSRFRLDPQLTGNLNAEYEALQNDLEQAKALAQDYQNQLSDKSNDLATLKLTLEHTAAHLAKLQENIVALRTERHNLANEVMKVVSLEAKLANAQAKIDSLTEDLKRERDERKRDREMLVGPVTGTGRNTSRRESIEMPFDEIAGVEILPTPVDPKPFRSGPR